MWFCFMNLCLVFSLGFPFFILTEGLKRGDYRCLFGSTCARQDVFTQHISGL